MASLLGKKTLIASLLEKKKLVASLLEKKKLVASFLNKKALVASILNKKTLAPTKEWTNEIYSQAKPTQPEPLDDYILACHPRMIKYRANSQTSLARDCMAYYRGVKVMNSLELKPC